jgi:hypothetical protein
MVTVGLAYAAVLAMAVLWLLSVIVRGVLP